MSFKIDLSVFVCVRVLYVGKIKSKHEGPTHCGSSVAVTMSVELLMVCKSLRELTCVA